VAELDGRWVTMNGAKVFISSKGDVIKGLGRSYHLKTLNDEQIVDLLEKHLDDYKNEFDPRFVKRGAGCIAIIGDELGAGQLPELITEDELAEEVANGGKELWRGFGQGGEKNAEQFKTGELYVGKGLYGCGTYTTPDKGVAEMYSGNKPDPKSMAHMVLKSDARIVEYDDMLGDYEKGITRNNLIAIKNARYPGVERFVTDDLKHFIHTFTFDVGGIGLLQGYDAIRVKDNKTSAGDYYVILNRGALKVVR